MVSYDFIRGTLVGNVVVAVSDKGLCAVKFGKRPLSIYVRKLFKMFPESEMRRDRAAVGPYRQEIVEYLEGKRTCFTRPIDLCAVRGQFQRKVLRRCHRVPFGRLVSYGGLASRAGSPGAARAVGAAMAANPLPIVVPCHRVIAAGGALGGYTGGLTYKRKLLALEGIPLYRGRVEKTRPH